MNEDLLHDIILMDSVFVSNLDALISIYIDTSKLRDRKIKTIDKKIKEITKKSFDLEKVVASNKEMFIEYNLYKHEFEYLFLNSLFISSFSLFENHLNKLVEFCEKASSSPIKLKDLKGNGIIDTARKYFELVHNFQSAKSELKEWKEITEFKAIRNAIVHNESLLNKDGNPKLNSIKGFSKIRQHNVYYSGDNLHFKLNQISFIEDFKKLSLEYVVSITKELINKYR